jgi:hypothetical protein
MKYTASQIKTEGVRRYLKRNTKRILILLSLTIGWIPLAVYIVSGNPTFSNYHIVIKLFIYLAPFVLVASSLVLDVLQARKRFYEKVKKNPELLG